MNHADTKVAIVITTRNRSDFLTRQLLYYQKLKSPHPIYIGNCSNAEHLEITRKTIEQIGDQLKIIHNEFGEHYTPAQSTYELLKQVTEKYACFNGDDDYHVPDALSECAVFLNENLDYATATSLTVNLKLDRSGAYGKLAVIKDYPRPELHHSVASERVVAYLNRYFVPIISVNRTASMVKAWQNYDKAPDLAFASEIIPSTLSVIDGKAKTLNRLGIVRQMHDRQFSLSFIYDWLTHKDWQVSHEVFLDICSKHLSKKENISIPEAEKTIRQGFWLYLMNNLAREYPEAYPEKPKPSQKILKSIRNRLVTSAPILKKIYRRYFVPIVTNRKQLHFEVTQKDSPYYKDFQPILESFSQNL